MDFLCVLLPGGDPAVRNHTCITLGFQCIGMTCTQGVCCGESEHLIRNKVYKDFVLVLYCHLLLIHLSSVLTMQLCVAPRNLL